MDLQTVTQWYDFTGRTVVITGGAGILGGEFACMLVGCGANVAILDRDPSLADRLLDRLGCGPGCSAVVYADVLKRETLIKAEETIEAGPLLL
jgi:NAD(P)-dependent dehydrogenase (short-subunit alcohol dehydrogenase family)